MSAKKSSNRTKKLTKAKRIQAQKTLTVTFLSKGAGAS
jgi:hypothetical protein